MSFIIKAYIFLFHRKAYRRFLRYIFTCALRGHVKQHKNYYINPDCVNDNHTIHLLKHQNNHD